METQIDDEIQDPSAYIQLGSFFKILKAVITICVFTLNGSKNDYFMAYFFFWTCFLGGFYFNLCGYRVPVTEREDRENKTLIYYYNMQIKDVLQAKQKTADWIIIALTFIAFIFGVLGFVHADDLFEGSSVSTMAATAVIMVLINLQAWPSIHEQLNKKKRLSTYDDVRERAIAFVSQLDVIIEFCTSIMQKMKDIADSKGDEVILTKDEKNQMLETEYMQFAPFEAQDAMIKEHQMKNPDKNAKESSIWLRGKIFDHASGELVVDEFQLRSYDPKESNTLPQFAFVGIDTETTHDKTVDVLMRLGDDGYFVHLKYESQKGEDMDEYLIFKEGTIGNNSELKQYAKRKGQLFPNCFVANSAYSQQTFNMVLYFPDQEDANQNEDQYRLEAELSMKWKN